MCGIAGFWGMSADAEGMTRIARAMGDAIRHRGPDGFGEYVLADQGLALSHRRLAIIDLSPAGVQPMRSHSGRWTIVFNGEIYNYLSVRRKIESARGQVAWRGHSDTEVLLEALELWGVEKALVALDGMFAFAAWDAHSSELVLARDRIGEKPLYYGAMPDGSLLFGSELRAMFAHPSWHGELDSDAVGLMMHYNSIPAPRSVFRGVFKLPPGNCLRIRNRKLEQPQPYWTLEDVIRRSAASRAAFSGGVSIAADHLESLLGDVVEEQMIADVPLGAFLSGGIDSSLIVAMMQKRSARPVKTFTIGFREDGFDEAQYARAVAAHLGTEHHELYLTGQDALGVVPGLADIYDEPFADASQLPTSLVARFARQHVSVALSGDAGDEVFGGYERYFIAAQLRQRIATLPRFLQRSGGRFLASIPPGMVDALARGLGPLCPRLLRVAPGDKLARLARMLRSASFGDFYDEFLCYWKDGSVPVPSARFHVASEAVAAGGAGASAIEFMMAHDSLAYLPSDILVKVDRAAMAVSLETRTPLLDRRIVEFAWSLPLQVKASASKGKLPLRELLARHVPKALFERPKQGFAVPLEAWLRGPLREWAESLLSQGALEESGLLDPEPIRCKWLDHVQRGGQWHYQLWNVLMFQAWLQRYRAYVN